MMTRWLLLLACIAWPVAAQEIAIYRCTDPQGALTVQNQPCPKGMRQEKKMMQTPAAAPLPALAPIPVRAPAPIAPLASTAAPAPAPPPVAKPAPPPLFECHRRDETHYLTEDTQSATYCVPMQVVGLDGNPQRGAGEACEVVSDTCKPVADDALCSAWREQLQDAESHWRFATPEHAGERQQAYARIRDLIAASNCADGAVPAPTAAPQNP